jgi:hypothetical protein
MLRFDHVDSRDASRSGWYRVPDVYVYCTYVGGRDRFSSHRIASHRIASPGGFHLGRLYPLLHAHVLMR